MTLEMWWMLLPLAAAFAIVLLLMIRRSRGAGDGRPVAHSERLTALPAYRRALRRRRTLLLTAAACGVIVLGSAALLAARPVDRDLASPQQHSRDIVLCLDVSPSMAPTNQAVLETFARLVRDFQGERISLVVFDNLPLQLFPLTDDYDFVAARLEESVKAMADGDDPSFAGAWGGAGGNSLIGDGLAGCAKSFPGEDDADRSRSMILATDNALAGTPIFTLEEAAAVAEQRNVRVYALNPMELYGDDPGSDGARLRTVAEDSGGAYYALDDPSAVDGIVHAVSETEATLLDAAPEATVTDRPGAALIVALIAGLALVVAGWRVDA